MIAGAYGVRLNSPFPPAALAVEGGDHWPELEVVVEPAPQPRTGDLVARRPEGNVCLAADRASVRLPLSDGVPAAELLHPVLATAAYLAAIPRGDVCLHGGAALIDGQAWGVLAPPFGGKSTLLGMLAAHGHPVVTDDVMVVHDTTLFAGPRCLDLRPDAAARFGAGDAVRRATRVRVPLPPARAEQPLRGFLHLAWHDGAPALAEVPAGERLRRLIAQTPGGAPDPVALLDLAQLPHVELRRPRDLDRAEAVLERLGDLDAVAA